MSTKGFSLIELLVVIVLIGTIGIIVSQVFVITIRSQAKSEIIKEMKQSGDHAMAVMESMVRNAVDIPQTSCNTNTQAFSIINPDGYTTTFDCSSGTNIASIGAQTLSLTSGKAAVSSCTFRVVCPSPATSPKYVFLTFTLTHVGGSAIAQELQASEDFQATVALRSSQ